LKYYSEIAETPFKGTIIDIETIGNFSSFRDSREYYKISPVILGALYENNLHIYYIEKRDELIGFKREIRQLLTKFPRPWYAFNCDFERGVFFHSLGEIHPFEYELNSEKYEGKGVCRVDLGIPEYGDPFNDVGKLCPQNWIQGNVDSCVKHNRACLLKERDILLKRGTRKPNKLKFISV